MRFFTNIYDLLLHYKTYSKKFVGGPEVSFNNFLICDDVWYLRIVINKTKGLWDVSDFNCGKWVNEWKKMQELVQMECSRWASKGVNIKYEVRDNRNGYKAGALKEGMKRSYVKQCDYVAIFDADFQPEPDFLWRTVPFLVNNPELGLVQARWKFGIFSFTQPLHLNFLHLELLNSYSDSYNNNIYVHVNVTFSNTFLIFFFIIS